MVITPLKFVVTLYLSVLLIRCVKASAAADPCIEDPTVQTCAGYVLPANIVTDDLTHLCTSMANMPGCGLWTNCKSEPGLKPAKYCDAFSILKLICADGMSNMGGCANWKSMCKPGSVVKECEMETLNVPGYNQAKAYVKDICADMPGMSGCANCTADIAKCDLLQVYSSLCNNMPDMTQCAGWQAYCANVPTWSWCSNFVSAPNAAPAGAPEAPIDCISSPSTTACASFKLPSDLIKANTDILCTAMNSMPGCTIRATCAATPDLKTSIYCEDFSIYKTLCSDMPKMNGCGNYTSMCAPGSVVNQCNTPAAPVPSTMKTFGYIKSICTEPGMLMEACYRCQGKNGPGTGMNCDLLTVYSDLCVDMPGMTQCSGWEDFCKVMDNWPYCSATAPDGTTQPVMRMWFHASISDYVLFYGWVPQNAVQYTGTWFAILFISIGFEFLKFLRSRLEIKLNDMLEDYKWDEPQEPQLLNDTDGEKAPISPPSASVRGRCVDGPRWYFSVDVPRAIFQSIEVIWSLMLMLVAMTYNIGLFLAIPAGAFIGTLVFGRFMAYKPPASCH